jgi:hypothetical protein
LLKGNVGLMAAVVRDDRVLAGEEPLDHLAAVRAGDALQLRVVGSAGRWVAVEGLDGDRWVPYFQGIVPPDGRVPVMIDIDARGANHLRVRACAGAPRDGAPAADCLAQSYEF